MQKMETWRIERIYQTYLSRVNEIYGDENHRKKEFKERKREKEKEQTNENDRQIGRGKRKRIRIANKNLEEKWMR